MRCDKNYTNKYQAGIIDQAITCKWAKTNHLNNHPNKSIDEPKHDVDKEEVGEVNVTEREQKEVAKETKYVKGKMIR